MKPSLSREPGEEVWKGGWFYGASADWTGALDIGTLVGLGGGFEYTAKAETEDGLGADKEGIFLRVFLKGSYIGQVTTHLGVVQYTCEFHHDESEWFKWEPYVAKWADIQAAIGFALPDFTR